MYRIIFSWFFVNTMGLKWFKVPSKFLLISWMCWFAIVRNNWEFLSNSHSPSSTNDNLANNPYFSLDLLANMADLLRPVYARLIILVIFHLVMYFQNPLSTSQDGITMRSLDGCWAKLNFFIFLSIWTPSKTGRLLNVEADAPLLAGLSCLYGLYCNNVSGWLLLSGAMPGSCLVLYPGYYSRPVVDHVSLRSTFSIAPLFERSCTGCSKFGGIVTSLLNGTVEKLIINHHMELRRDMPSFRFDTRAICGTLK